jgi:membrane protein required for beta-lactamase induction
MSFSKDDRKNQSIHGKSLHAERFSEAIARALHREFDQTHSAIKTVVALTGANERAVRNWFEAKNGPNGEFLIALCRHSDQVLETFLLLAGRRDHLRARTLVRAKDTLQEILVLLNELETEDR